MKTHTETFTFTIPQNSPSYNEEDPSKNKLELPFTYEVIETEHEAKQYLEKKERSLVSIVNDILKANGRSNAYQAAVAKYKPSTVSPEDIIERMVRDYVRLGIPEDAARIQVESMLRTTKPE